MNARPGWRELHPPLAVHLGLLLLTILLLGAMPAIEAAGGGTEHAVVTGICLLYTSPSPRDKRQSRMPSSA